MDRFYLCKKCGTMVGLIKLGHCIPTCCGEQMTALEPNTTEAATEKHLPVISVDGNNVTVSVGSVAHPMSAEHYIEWVYIETSCGGKRFALNPDASPVAKFALIDGEKLIAAYAYCNLHGLWKTEF